MLYSLDLTGTFVFAISGFLTAGTKKFDIFGATIIAFVTALGGGTIRDVLIGRYPLGWMRDLHYLLIIVLAVVVGVLFKKQIIKLRRTMFLFDSIGISMFTIAGVEATLEAGLHPVIAVMMGIVSAVFGGVVRDILCNVIPLIFRKEIYATVCLLGGVLYLSLRTVNPNLATVVTVAFILFIRVLAVRKKWALPRLN